MTERERIQISVDDLDGRPAVATTTRTAIHAHLLRSPERTVLRAEPGATVLVNGRAVGETRLRSGDTLQVGSTQISYGER